MFSGDGASGNPNDSVIKSVVEGRLEADSLTPFTLWFTTSETRPTSSTKQNVMAKAIKEANDAADKNPDQITVRVLSDDETVHTMEVDT